MKKAKKFIILAAAAILIYTLIVHPTMLGDGVQTIFGWIGSGIDAIIAFLRSVAD
jgi:hypothetical protein